MTRRKRRSDNLLQTLRDYSDSRTLDMKEFSDVHIRLTDEFTTIDIWPTTGKYFVLKTDYANQTKAEIVERGGEKGLIPYGVEAIYEYLDKLFFAADF